MRPSQNIFQVRPAWRSLRAKRILSFSCSKQPHIPASSLPVFFSFAPLQPPRKRRNSRIFHRAVVGESHVQGLSQGSCQVCKAGTDSMCPKHAGSPMGLENPGEEHFFTGDAHQLPQELGCTGIPRKHFGSPNSPAVELGMSLEGGKGWTEQHLVQRDLEGP